jgi:regulator of replication initiation timing
VDIPVTPDVRERALREVIWRLVDDVVALHIENAALRDTIATQAKNAALRETLAKASEEADT